MALVEIATQAWGVVQDRQGNVRSALPFTLTEINGGATVPRYTDDDGLTVETQNTTTELGEIPGFVEAGAYQLTVDGRPRQVEALTASGLSALPVNVKALGAAGDGVTDDTAAIQAAQALGEDVFFPAGNYLVRGTVACDMAGQNFSGPGTLLFPADGVRSDADIRFFFITAQEVTFEGLTFDGNNVATWNVTPSHDWMVLFDYDSDRGAVRDCIFKDFSRPSGHLAACVGVLGQTTVDGIVVESNRFSNLGGGAVFIQARDCLVANNHIDTCGDNPIAINSANARGNVVTGNTVLNTTEFAAIAVEEGAYDWIIADNVVRGCQRGLSIMHSLFAGPARGGGMFVDNVVTDTAKTGAAADNFAVHISSALYRGIVIRGNRLAGVDRVGTNTSIVYLQADTEGLVIDDNLIEGKAQDINGITFSSGTHSKTSIRRNVIRSDSSTTKLTRGIWLGSGATFTDAAIDDNLFENITNYCVRFDGSFGGRLRDNRGLAVGALYNASPWVPGGNSSAVLPHVYDNTTNGRSEIRQTGVPVAGTWKVGDIVWAQTPAAGGVPGWVCTTAGTPGTWKAMAAVAA